MSEKRCNSWDSGWCYHPESGVSECPGGEECPMKKPPSRIDVIGQNGGDGEHYKVKDICKIIQSSHKASPKYDWEDWIPEVLKILEVIDGKD